MPRFPNETVPRQFRLTQDTLDDMDALAKFHGFRSRTALLRFLVAQARKDMASFQKKEKSKKRKL